MARKVFEPAAAELLAQRATPDDIADLKAVAGALAVLVNEGTKGADFGEWSAATFRFHDLILERAGNNTLMLVGAVLREVITRHMTRAVSAATSHAVIEKQFKQTIRVFTKFTALIESGAAVEAREYWAAHMGRAGRNMLWGDLANETVIDLYV